MMALDVDGGVRGAVAHVYRATADGELDRHSLQSFLLVPGDDQLLTQLLGAARVCAPRR